MTRHPVELYAAVLLVVAAIALFRLRLRYPPPFVIAGLSVAAAGAARWLTEPLRPALFAGPVWWYAAAVGAGVLVALSGWRAGARRPDPGTGSLQ